MVEHTYSLEFTVRLPDGAPVTDDALDAALLLTVRGEARPLLSKQVKYINSRSVSRHPYALTADIRMPNNNGIVVKVGVMAYDEYQAAALLREQLGDPDPSDFTLISVTKVTHQTLGYLQRIDV